MTARVLSAVVVATAHGPSRRPSWRPADQSTPRRFDSHFVTVVAVTFTVGLWPLNSQPSRQCTPYVVEAASSRTVTEITVLIRSDRRGRSNLGSATGVDVGKTILEGAGPDPRGLIGGRRGLWTRLQFGRGSTSAAANFFLLVEGEVVRKAHAEVHGLGRLACAGGVVAAVSVDRHLEALIFRDNSIFFEKFEDFTDFTLLLLSVSASVVPNDVSTEKPI